MEDYHKIQTVFFRDPENKRRTLLEGRFSLPEFEYLANNDWIFTEKVDGTNIRVMFDGQNISIKGREKDSLIPDFLMENLSSTFMPMEEVFREKFPNGVCIYGEGYGERIQDVGRLYIPKGQSFVLFDIKIGKWWLERTAVNDISHSLGLSVVPIIGQHIS